MNIKDLLQKQREEFEKKLPQLISDLVWSASDGGYKLLPNQVLAYQGETLTEYTAIESLVSQIQQELIQEFKKKVEESKLLEVATNPTALQYKKALNRHLSDLSSWLKGDTK